MKTISVEPLDVSAAKEEESRALTILTGAKGLSIVNQDSYETAGLSLQMIKGRLKWLEEKRKAITQPLDVAKKAVMDFFRVPTSFYEEAEGIVKKSMLAYAQEEERKRQELEAKLHREAEKKRQELEAKAETARANGKEAQAEKYEEKAAQVIEPILAPILEQPKGVSFREVWHAEVLDFAKLPDNFKIADMPKLNKLAQATKGTLDIPGVKFFKEKIVASKAEAT